MAEGHISRYPTQLSLFFLCTKAIDFLSIGGKKKKKKEKQQQKTNIHITTKIKTTSVIHNDYGMALRKWDVLLANGDKNRTLEARIAFIYRHLANLISQYQHGKSWGGGGGAESRALGPWDLLRKSWRAGGWQSPGGFCPHWTEKQCKKQHWIW